MTLEVEHDWLCVICQNAYPVAGLATCTLCTATFKRRGTVILRGVSPTVKAPAPSSTHVDTAGDTSS